jgi:hypothetical protein
MMFIYSFLPLVFALSINDNKQKARMVPRERKKIKKDKTSN